MDHKRNLSSPSRFCTSKDNMASIPEQDTTQDDEFSDKSPVTFSVGQPPIRTTPQKAKRSQSNDDSQSAVAHGRRRSIIKEPGRPPLPKKTVSFSRLPNESLVKNAADCVALMQGGHHFVKLRSNSRVYNRFYWFEASTNCLHWEPSKKDQLKAKIGIPSIKEVRAGKATESFITSDISSHFPEECAFSIVYGDYKNLDLIASSADDANVWITGLRCLLAGKNAEELQSHKDTRDLWLEAMFDSADINKDGFLDEDESLELLKSLSDGIRETRIKQKMTELLRFKNEDKTKLTKNEFVELFKDVTTRPEIYFLLARHSSKDDILSVNDLQLFLETEQGADHITREDCLKLIETYEPSAEVRSGEGLGIDGFTKYLMSIECNIFSPKQTEICQDMTQPLSHYFIASSHNTYLLEDQINGPCSVTAYVRALLRCCRCIELDCWDGEDGEPIIAHAHDSKSSVKFEHAIESINESAFKNSPYPVILCIDNHCSNHQQIIMANVLKNVLKDQLYLQESENGTEFLPSPEDLKYKFIIRGKKLPPSCCEDEGEVSEEDEEYYSTATAGDYDNKSSSPMSPNSKGTSFVMPPPIKNHVPHKRTLVRALSDLVTLCVSRHMNANDDFIHYHQTCNLNHFTSIHERTANRLVENQPEEFVNHNKKFLNRVYPNIVRVDSSNFNPQDYWNCGLQIASLNYQTPGLMMDINDGRFSMNGRCGYVLKPAIMRDQVAYFTANSNDIIPGISPKTLHLRIISGQEFPKPRGGGAKGQVIDPYVLIEMFGMPADCSEQRTRTAHDCGSGLLSAIFDESFEFHLSVPELALVRFVVLDDEFIGDEFIGQYTIPFECLQPGYRHLRLRSIFDEPLENATLFVHIQITDTYAIYPNTPTLSGLQTPNSPAMALSSSAGGMKLPKKGKTKKNNHARKVRATTIRLVGVQKIDNLFKTSEPPLKEVIEVKEKLQLSLLHFKEVCGLTMLCSIKHCMRTLTTRARSHYLDMMAKKQSLGNTENIEIPKLFKISMDDRTDSLHLDLHEVFVTEQWKKVVQCFNSLACDAQKVLQSANGIHQKLSDIQAEVMKQHGVIPLLLASSSSVSNSPTTHGGKKKKKLTKKNSAATVTGEKYQESNFTWNCSVIRGHLDSLTSICTEAKNTLVNICQSATDLNLITMETCHEFLAKISSYSKTLIDENQDKDKESISSNETSSSKSDSSVQSNKNVNNNNFQNNQSEESVQVQNDEEKTILQYDQTEKLPVVKKSSLNDPLPVTTL